MWQALSDLWVTFGAFLGQLGTVLALAGANLLPWLPFVAWCAWWLWGVNWTKAWPVLRRGGWVGIVLLIVAGALAWSSIFPTKVANFWWQFGACSALATAALFCGWLQGLLGWTPAEVSFEPPAPEHGHHAHH